jgi:large subunit ribosomal protein L30
MAKLKVTLVRSAIGRRKDQRATLAGLGLRRLNSTAELEDTPSVRGMVKKVIHLLEVQEIS